MHILLDKFLREVTYGELQQSRGLTVIPLFAPVADQFEYLSMSQALEQGLLVITEISQGGSVPQLQVENKGEIAVLLLDGEELAGAKQNRVLNTSILVKPHSVTIIPVSCTEQGRWSYLSPQFAESGNLLSPRIRQGKMRSVSHSLMSCSRAESDQSEVWREIRQMAQTTQVESPTVAMNDIFTAQKDRLREMTDAFQCLERQNGLIVLDEHRVIGFDIVSSPKVFERIFRKLLNSYAIEFITREHSNHSNPIETARRFMDSLTSVPVTVHESVGLGQDCRFVSNEFVGSALIVEQAVIHTAFFATESSEPNQTMSGVSRRRGFRS